MSHRKLSALFSGLIVSMTLTVGTASPANAAPYDDFVRQTNAILDGWDAEKGGSAGFRAARALFDTPKYSQASWNSAGLLCRFFRGDSSASGGQFAADVVWPTEKTLLDTFTAAGGSVYDWADFMLVRFTVLAAAINGQCPSYNSLVMGPFSDRLYEQFNAYRNDQGASESATPTAPSEPAGQPVVTDPAAIATALARKPQPDSIFGFPPGGFAIPPQPSAWSAARRGNKLVVEVLTNSDGKPYEVPFAIIRVYDTLSAKPRCQMDFRNSEIPPEDFKCRWKFPKGAKNYGIYAVTSYEGGYISEPMFNLGTMTKKRW